SELRSFKAEIVSLLRDGCNESGGSLVSPPAPTPPFGASQSGDSDDWQEWFDERAGILEYEGELTRQEAERQAFEATIIHWMNLTPPQNLDDDHCAQCGDPVGRVGNDAVPCLTGGSGHVWLHHGCHSAWMARRRQQATEALNAMGIG
ncbi:MAG: hypothetical protein HN584_03385, partial [Akkermansiaceae bacterium]|nr:hypothetical protein [Akkermansiaceae bacterium]